MAYDEVLEHQSQMRMSAAFPTLLSVNLSIETNPHADPKYNENILRRYATTTAVESLGNPTARPEWGYCANPHCYGSQISIISLIGGAYRPDGGQVIIDQWVDCTGRLCRRRMTRRERWERVLSRLSGKSKANQYCEYDGWLVDMGLHKENCQNSLRITGSVQFMDSMNNSDSSLTL